MLHKHISVLVLPANRAKLVRAGGNTLIQSLVNVSAGQKTIIDLTAVSEWRSVKLAEATLAQGITRHLFKP